MKMVLEKGDVVEYSAELRPSRPYMKHMHKSWERAVFEESKVGVFLGWSERWTGTYIYEDQWSLPQQAFQKDERIKVAMIEPFEHGNRYLEPTPVHPSDLLYVGKQECFGTVEVQTNPDKQMTEKELKDLLAKLQGDDYVPKR